MNDTIRVLDMLEYEIRPPVRHGGKRRRLPLEGEVGTQLRHDPPGIVRKSRVIDRRGDRYEEIVEDVRTGEVIHVDRGRLSDHKGYGSDRPDRRG